jgi:hypothetical protein
VQTATLVDGRHADTDVRKEIWVRITEVARARIAIIAQAMLPNGRATCLGVTQLDGAREGVCEAALVVFKLVAMRAYLPEQRDRAVLHALILVQADRRCAGNAVALRAKRLHGALIDASIAVVVPKVATLGLP